MTKLISKICINIPTMIPIPHEIIIEILLYLNYKSVLQFLKTNNTYYRLLHNSLLWKEKCRLDFDEYDDKVECLDIYKYIRFHRAIKFKRQYRKYYRYKLRNEETDVRRFMLANFNDCFDSCLESINRKIMNKSTYIDDLVIDIEHSRTFHISNKMMVVLNKSNDVSEVKNCIMKEFGVDENEIQYREKGSAIADPFYSKIDDIYVFMSKRFTKYALYHRSV